MEGESSDLILFFGRFHPLILHIPIGFLTIACILELMSRIPRFAHFRATVGFVLLLGSLSAALAAVLGLMLARDGGYQDTLLSWHQWTGIGVAVFSAVAVLLRRKLGRHPSISLDRAYLATLSLMILTLGVAGHFGGSLTHGSDYLTRYMPDGLRKLTGVEQRTPASYAVITDVDQALVYEQVIHPILDSYCTSCHNDEKRKGDLMMHTADHLLAGGESGAALLAGDAAGSDMIKRIHLPEDHDDHMPPEGKRQIPEEDVRLLEWWINEGAPFDKRVAEVETDSVVMAILAARADPSAAKSEAEKLLDSAIAPVNEVVLASFRKKGVMVRPLSNDVHWLQADVSPGNPGDSLVKEFDAVGEHITWLDLSGTSVSDAALASLARFRHLTRLHLGKTAVTDQGLVHLKDLHYLESLNLYGTGVSDTGLIHLRELPGLRRLYLWQTNVTEEGVSLLRQARPDLEVVLGEEVN